MRLIRNTFIYFLVTFLQKTVQFFLLPVYTAFLTVRDYGIINLVIPLTNILMIFFSLSLPSAGTRLYYRHFGDEEKIRKIWGVIFTFVMVNSVFFFVLITCLYPWVLRPLMKGVDFYPYVFLGLVASVFYPGYFIYQSDLQARQKGGRFGINNFAYFLCNALLIILFITVFRLKATGVLLALLLTNFGFFVYTLFVYVPGLKLGLDGPLLKSFLVYSLPLVPHALAGWLMTAIDRFFLNTMVSTSAVGIYGIGFIIANVIGTVSLALNQAYVPWFFEMAEKGEEGKARIRKFSEIFVVFYCLLALGLILLSPEVLTVMVTADFRSGWTVVPMLAFAFVFNGVYYLAVNALFLKRTRVVPFIILAGILVSVGSNTLLVRSFGILGAAVSNFLALLVMSLLTVFFSERTEKMSLPWGRIYGFIAAAFVLSLSVYLKGYIPAPAYIGLKAVILVSVIATAGLYYRKDIRRVVDIMLKRFGGQLGKI